MSINPASVRGFSFSPALFIAPGNLSAGQRHAELVTAHMQAAAGAATFLHTQSPFRLSLHIS
ncbi:MAG TPA: hypothetical protein VMJ11_01590 [Paraburkholderia sp.]|nr:hypothetical protein [Paraburkholderia sp.]